MPVSVIIDDADSVIKYEGNWTAVDPKGLGTQYQGVTQSIGNTLRNASDIINNATLTFSFNGTSVALYAIMTPDSIQRAMMSPSWFCTVNGSPIQTSISLAPLDQVGSVAICSTSNLPQVQENIIMLTSIPDENIFILFDYLEYTPSFFTPTQIYRYISVGYDNSTIQYKPSNDNWFVSETGIETRGSASHYDFETSVEYVFLGTSITWVGWSGVGADASISVTLDGTPATSIALQGHDANSSTLLPTSPLRVIFQITELNITIPHVIKVAYKPNNKTSSRTPLTLHSFMIGDGSAPALNTIGAVAPSEATGTTISFPSTPHSQTSFSSNTSLPTTASGGHKAALNHKSVIVIILVVVSTSCFTVGLIWWRRRRLLKITPNDAAIEAFKSSVSPEVNAEEIIYQVPAGPRQKGVVPTHLPVSDTYMVPPSKQRRSEVTISTSAPSQSQNVPEDEGEVRGPGGTRRRDVHSGEIQEEDSGLRMVEEMGLDDEQEVVRILPPVYTPE